MATALDLLMSTKEDVNLLSEESDICTIDAKTRAIFVPSTIVVGGVQSDKNAERIKFSCPKIVGDNLDLSKFSVRINFENVSSVDFNVSIKDQYICDDVAVDGENVTFSWLIGRNAARYMGTVRFIVCAVKTDSDSNISVEWNTTIAEVPVLEGIEIDQPQIGEQEKDIINQLLELTKNTSAEAVQNVNSAKEQAIKDIQSVSQPDTTLTIEGGLAEAKATGEAIGSLKEDFVEQFIENDGLISLYKYPIFWRSGGFIIDTNGDVGTSSDNYNYSGYIDVSNNDYVYVNLYFTTTSGIAFYDSNKKYISGVHNTVITEPFKFNKLVKIPVNAKFMRVTTRKITDTTFYCFVNYEYLLKAYKNWKNLAFRANKYLNFTVNSTGEFVKSDGTFRTDLFNIEPITKYKTNFSGRIAFYDKERAFVSTQVLSDENSFVSPDNAAYSALGGVRAINDYENIYVNAIEDITIGGINRLAAVGHFETELQSYIGYKSDWQGDDGSRFYLIPKKKVVNGTGGCLKIFGDNYPSQGDYRDLGIYFSANQNGDDGFYHNGVNWINVKVYNTGEYANKHPDLGFSFQDGAVIAGKVFCFDEKKPYWLFGAKTPTMQSFACAEFVSNIGINYDGGGIILKSPNGTKYKISVSDTGTLTTSLID